MLEQTGAAKHEARAIRLTFLEFLATLDKKRSGVSDGGY
jgi:hypothetical protein